MKKEVLDGILNALEWAVSDVDDIAKAARKGEDVDLRSMIIDSFQFISFIMDVEDQLNIEVPDELLVYDHLASLLGFAELMSTVKEEYKEEEYKEEEDEEEEDQDKETELNVLDRTMRGPWSGFLR